MPKNDFPDTYIDYTWSLHWGSSVAQSLKSYEGPDVQSHLTPSDALGQCVAECHLIRMCPWLALVGLYLHFLLPQVKEQKK